MWLVKSKHFSLACDVFLCNSEHRFVVSDVFYRWIQKRRQMLFVQAAALVTTLYALVWSRIRLVQSEQQHISYGPMSKRYEERQANLRIIYNCNNVECVNMLRMRRAPFFTCATC
jgi:hypothetical protein